VEGIVPSMIHTIPPFVVTLTAICYQALEGSPVCFYCPTCRSGDSIKGLKRDVGASNRPRVNAFDKERVISLLLQTVSTSHATRQPTKQLAAAGPEQRAAQPIHGKELPRCSNYDRISGWSSKVDLTCCRGHTWSASVVNVVFGRTWCRSCLQEERSLGEQDFHRTAQQMGGTFLGFSSPILIDSDAKVTKGV
jgi:hypothetical protein